MLLLDEKSWIKQHTEHTLYPELTLEENAVAQIEEIYNGFQQALNEQEQAENE